MSVKTIDSLFQSRRREIDSHDSFSRTIIQVLRTGECADNRSPRVPHSFLPLFLFYSPTYIKCMQRAVRTGPSLKRALRRTGWEPVVRLLGNIVIRPSPTARAVRFICATEIKMRSPMTRRRATGRAKASAKGGKRLAVRNAMLETRYLRSSQSEGNTNRTYFFVKAET